jgi:hypothetical protein
LQSAQGITAESSAAGAEAVSAAACAWFQDAKASSTESKSRVRREQVEQATHARLRLWVSGETAISADPTIAWFPQDRQGSKDFIDAYVPS